MTYMSIYILPVHKVNVIDFLKIVEKKMTTTKQN